MAEKDSNSNFAKVIDFPKEVKIYGDFSHVYIKGRDKSSTLVIDQNNSSPSKEKKSKKEPVLIIPIKQKEGELEFVKVPLYKLSKEPKAESTGEVSCSKVNFSGSEPRTENIPQYKMEQRDFPKPDPPARTNHYQTCFVFQQEDPLPKNLFMGSAIPEVDLFQFQKTIKQNIKETKDKEVQVSSESEDLQGQDQRKSSKDLEKNREGSRSFLRFLVTQKKNV